MPRRGDGVGPRIAREIITSLPAQHRKTTQSPPEREMPDIGLIVETGIDDPAALGSAGHRVIGFLFWVGWFSWGVYTWWFVDRTPTDFVIGVVVWAAAFLFAVVGIPLVRHGAKDQQLR